MIANNNKRSRARGSRQRRRRQRDGGASLGQGVPDPRGDIPRRRKCTQMTTSCGIPRTTQMVTLHHVTEGANLLQSASTAVTAQYNFQLSSLDIASAVTGLWDQYRIDCIRWTLIPDNNAIPIENTSNTALSQVYCVIDYDDSTALATAQAAKKYDNLAIVEPAESICRQFQPRAALAAYSGVFTSFANVAGMWIDIASPSVQHYGIKVYIPPGIVGQTFLQSWKVEIEYWVSYRSVV